MTKGSKPTAGRSFQTLLGVVVACILGLLAIGGFKGYRDLRHARTRELAIASEIQEAAIAVRQLETRIRALRDDPSSLERMAREQFNMVHPNDVVIVLPAKEVIMPERDPHAEDQS